MPAPGRVPCLARIHAKPKVESWCKLCRANVTNTCRSRYARDAKQLEVLKSLSVLKPRLLDLFAGKSLKGDIEPRESVMGLSFNGSSTTGSVEEGSYPFALDLAAAVCPSPVTAWCSH